MLYKDTAGFHPLPYPTVLFCIRLRNIASRLRDQFAQGTKTVSASFEEFLKETTLSF